MSGKSFEDWIGTAETRGEADRPSRTVAPAASQPAVAASVVAAVGAAEEYQAFGLEHPELRGEVIDVRYGDEWCQVERRFLVRVEGAGDTFLALVCTNFAVLIAGRHLGELRRRLAARKVDFVQQFDRARWPVPAPGVPVVESVELVMADSAVTDGIAVRKSCVKQPL